MITTKQMEHSPQYTIQLRDWRTGDEVARDDFVFGGPAGASSIEITQLREIMSELPQHFSIGAQR